MRTRCSKLRRFEELEGRLLLAVLVVDTLDDSVVADGRISFPEAILAANDDLLADAIEGIQMGDGADIIQFAPSIFGGNIQTSGLTVTDSLIIEGPGQDLLTVSFGQLDVSDQENGYFDFEVRHLRTSSVIVTYENLVVHDSTVVNIEVLGDDSTVVYKK